MVKPRTEEEIALLRENAILVSKTLAEVGKAVAPGVTGQTGIEAAEMTGTEGPEHDCPLHLLQKQLHTPAFRRRDLAWTDGRPAADRGVLDFPIAKAPGATVKRIVSGEGKQSRTKYRVLREQGNGALVLLELETGRTHQIRVHLSHTGCPVKGDFLYGTELPEAFPGCFALHSALLEVRHPVTGELIRVTSLPDWAGDLDPSVLLMDFD